MASLQEIMALASGVSGTKAEDYDVAKTTLKFSAPCRIKLADVTGYFGGENVRDELAHVREAFPKATLTDVLRAKPQNGESVAPIHAAWVSDIECLQLVQSIRTHGVQTPVIVWKPNKTTCEIVSGSRRLGSAAVAGLIDVPAIIVTGSEEDVLDLMIRENSERKEGTPLDEGRKFARLHGSPEPGKGKGETIESLARKYGKGSGTTGPDQYIRRCMALAFLEKKLGAGVAHDLAQSKKAKTFEKIQKTARDARAAVEKGLVTWSDLKAKTDDGKPADMQTVASRVKEVMAPKTTGPKPMYDYGQLRAMALSEDARECEQVAQRLVAKFDYDDVGTLSVQILDVLRCIFGLKATAPKVETDEK